MRTRSTRSKGRWGVAAEPLTWPANFDISGAVYDNKSFDCGAKDPFGANSYVWAVCFGDSGKKFYTGLGGSGSTRIIQYDLAVPYNISTASYNGKYKAGSSFGSPYPRAIYWNQDGTRFYSTANNGVSYQTRDPLSTPWDISTVSAVDSFYKASGNSYLSQDGTKLFNLIYNSGWRVYKYILSTPWDMSTATYNSMSSPFSADTDPNGIFLDDKGKNIFITGSQNDRVYQFVLGTAWDVTTFDGPTKYLSISSQGTNPTTLTFKELNGKYMLVVDTNRYIYQYKCY